jgi:uncharacterized iron-regulated membrane protein
VPKTIFSQQPRIKNQQEATRVRWFRTWHQQIGLVLLIFFVVMALTGILLAWKKHSFGLMQPSGLKGQSKDLADWMPVADLLAIAQAEFVKQHGADAPASLERIDIRLHKGLVKFVFEDRIWGIELDGATGEILHSGRRYSDLIEKIHDGSVLALLLPDGDDYAKRMYSTLTGLGLLGLTLSGFWLWYGPKRIRERKRKPLARD